MQSADSVRVDLISPRESGGVYLLCSHRLAAIGGGEVVTEIEMVGVDYDAVVREFDSLLARRIANRGYSLYWWAALVGFKHVYTRSPWGVSDMYFPFYAATQHSVILANCIDVFIAQAANLRSPGSNGRPNPNLN